MLFTADHVVNPVSDRRQLNKFGLLRDELQVVRRDLSEYLPDADVCCTRHHFVVLHPQLCYFYVLDVQVQRELIYCKFLEIKRKIEQDITTTDDVS